jgi:iron complex outermembrane receptor protein
LRRLPAQAGLEELKQLSIEELVDTDVTTASRRIERLADVAAAVTVISSEDLRRMGVTTLAQAMRLAGHMHVSQISGPQYGITARGFAISTANKMLVLIDGRTVYSPVFAGVFWETQDMSLLDIDRIEVIRGPGGSIWGANAVNGVINVISKRATETKGHARGPGGGIEHPRAVHGAPWRTHRQFWRLSSLRKGSL